MATIILILGIVCLGYYVFLQLLQMDFAVIWLGVGAASFVTGCGYLWLQSQGRTIPSGFIWCLGFGTAICMAGFLIVEALVISGMCSTVQDEPDYVIVLGAQVKGDHPSIALQKRIDTAEEFLRDHKNVKAILSGGQGPGEDMTEASCMAEVLVARGIQPERLLLEEKSTSTKENLIYSARLVRGLKEKRVVLVTQNFHVYRSLKLAKHQEFQYVQGLPAPSVWLYQPHFMVREAFALVKEKLVGNI